MRDAGDRLPGRAVAFEVRHERGVDDVVLERVHEDRRDQAAVLPDVEQLGVGRTGEHDVLADARDLVGLAHATEQELVDLRFPRAKPWAGTRARGAGLVAVAAVARAAVVVLGLHRLVDAEEVVVVEHVVRARDDATGAPGAEPRRDHLVVEVLPREAPAFLLLDRFGGGHRLSARPRRGAGSLSRLRGRDQKTTW